MSKTKEKCTCDVCGVRIVHGNDDNELKVNMALYHLCPKCFAGTCVLLDKILGSGEVFRGI